MICRRCKSEFEPYLRNGIVISRLCIKCVVLKNKEQMKKKQLQLQREAKKELLTHSDYQNLLQKQINKLVRIIDVDFPCIARDTRKGKMNAGHYFSVGSNNSLRFNLHNIHKQSEYSNKYNHGDAIMYLIGIKKRYGIDYANYLLSLPELYPYIKLTIPELIEKIEIVKKIIREHKSENLKKTEIIEIREKYNKIIGIYDN